MACGRFILAVGWNYRFFIMFPADRLHDWGILFVIPLEFQESIDRLMAQPTAKKPCGALMRVLGCGTRPLFTAGKGGPALEIFTFSVVS